MQFYEVIENRSSVKKYKNSPIEKDRLARIINATMMSPSWKNNTSYKLLIVDDKKVKEMLAESIKNDTNEAAMSVKEAPVTAIVVADPSKSGVVEGREYYLVDSAIAMEHFILAATSEGYGTCWIGAVDEDKVREILDIPNEYRVIAMTPLGEIAENITHHYKKDVREYVYMNKWGKAYTENNTKRLH